MRIVLVLPLLLLLNLLSLRTTTTAAAAAASGTCKRGKGPWMDSSLPARTRAELILDCMTLEEKAGQIVTGHWSEVEDDPDYALLAGSLLGGGDGFNIPGGGTAREWALKIAGIQEQSVCQSRLGIPLLYAHDAVHGNSGVEAGVIFPHNVGLGAICAGHKGQGLRECAQDVMIPIGRAIDQAVQAAGIHWNYAPTICVSRDLRWGRAYECFGSDPELVNAMSVMTEGLQESGMTLATARHYTGDGGVEWGTSLDYPIDRGTNPLARLGYEMEPYYEEGAAIPATIMASYSGFLEGEERIDMHANGYLLTNILRATCEDAVLTSWYSSTDATCLPAAPWSRGLGGEDGGNAPESLDFGCDRIVVGDYLGFYALPGTKAEAIASSLNAGVDVSMPAREAPQFISAVIEGICDGKKNGGGVEEGCKANCIPEARLDEATRRILTAKFELGLFDHPWPMLNSTCVPDNMPPTEWVDDEDSLVKIEARKLALSAAEKSLVLLKHTKGTLPFRTGTDNGETSTADESRGSTSDKSGSGSSSSSFRILVTGSAADDTGLLAGGWTIVWQGGYGKDFVVGGTTVMDALSSRGGVTVVGAEASVAVKAKVDAAVVVVSEPPYAEGFGDVGFQPGSGYNTLLSVGDRRAVRECASLDVPCVVVVVAGRPLYIEHDLMQQPGVDAVIMAWLPGSEGGRAIANALFSRTFTGKLPVPWPVLPSAGPDSEIAFPYGYGCSTSAAKDCGVKTGVAPGGMLSVGATGLGAWGAVSVDISSLKSETHYRVEILGSGPGTYSVLAEFLPSEDLGDDVMEGWPAGGASFLGTAFPSALRGETSVTDLTLGVGGSVFLPEGASSLSLKVILPYTPSGGGLGIKDVLFTALPTPSQPDLFIQTALYDLDDPESIVDADEDRNKFFSVAWPRGWGQGGVDTDGTKIMYTEEGEELSYTRQFREGSEFHVFFRYSGRTPGRVALEVDGGSIASLEADLPATGSYNVNFREALLTAKGGPISVPAGTHKVTVRILKPGFHHDSIRFFAQMS